MTASKARILVVEDETAIRRGLCDLLVFHGWQPVPAVDGDEGRRLGLVGDCHLALLDVMLPGVDGLTLCRELRAAQPQLGICMLTAKGAEADILNGFQAGADDYVCKPFSMAQLVVRVEALLRRAGPASAPPQELILGALRCREDDLLMREGGASVAITRLDYAILALLASEPGRIVSRRNLLSTVWEYPNPDAVETRCVDMQIAKLRKKLSQLPHGPELIATVRGEGYRLQASAG